MSTALPTQNDFLSRGIVKVVNKLDAPLEKSGVTFVDLSVKSLLDSACRQTGLSDWGSEDFIEGLEQLITSFQAEAHLNLIGEINLHQELILKLTNRLRVQQLVKDHPEIKERPLSRPVFILGYPRTGTTLLHRLLAQDTEMRVPLLWELLRPVPAKSSRKNDPRIKAAQWLVWGQRLFLPGLEAIHPLNATEPDECVFLFHNTLYYTVRGDIPSYVKWFAQHDMAPDYRYYRLELQVLDWQRSSTRWVTKTPFHLWSLDALLAVFPDACIVQLHRDPKKVIPSWCSLVEQVLQASTTKLDRNRIGQSCVDLWIEGMTRALQVRASANPAQFYDIYYDDLIADPVGAVDRLYQYFDFPLSANTQQDMRNWLAIDRQKRHPVHHYSLEKFGLTPTFIDERFGFYNDHFKIETH